MSNSEANHILVAALEYANRGWAVLPLDLYEVIEAVLARTGIPLPHEAMERVGNEQACGASARLTTPEPRGAYRTRYGVPGQGANSPVRVHPS